MSIVFHNQCPNCGAALQPVENLDSICSNQFDCLMCGSRFAYERQVTNTRSPVEKVLICAVCSKQFNQSSSLKRHLAVHTGERPFSCESCDKSFKTKAALKRHNIIHTGECPYECSTCKRKFNQISNLRKHLVIHSNNCPYFCTTCGKGFNQSSNLRKHLVVHQERRDDLSPKRSKKSVHATETVKKSKRPVLTFVRPAES